MRIKTVLAAIVMLTVNALGQVGSPQQVKLNMHRLCCDAPTDTGLNGPADEVYMLLLIETSDGRVKGLRLPADAPHEARGHWDMTKDPKAPTDAGSGDSHCIGSTERQRELYAGDVLQLLPGQTASVTVFVMEEDQGFEGLRLGPVLETVARAVPEATVQRGAEIINRLLAKMRADGVDKDDFVGSFKCQIRRGKGEADGIDVVWAKGERVKEQLRRNRPEQQEFRLNGDGSDYVITLEASWEKVGIPPKLPTLPGTWRGSLVRTEGVRPGAAETWTVELKTQGEIAVETVVEFAFDTNMSKRMQFKVDRVEGNEAILRPVESPDAYTLKLRGSTNKHVQVLLYEGNADRDTAKSYSDGWTLLSPQ